MKNKKNNKIKILNLIIEHFTFKNKKIKQNTLS